MITHDQEPPDHTDDASIARTVGARCVLARSVVVVAGGSPLRAHIGDRLPPSAFVIAADSGLDHAIAAGIRPDLVVGDLDSVSDAGLAWAAGEDIAVDRHPSDKDSTDTELAIATALAMEAEEIVLVGGGSTAGDDRLDHSIGALTALGHRTLAAVGSVSAHWGSTDIAVLHGPRSRAFELEADATFSLLALHGACAGVTLEGAKWPLTDATLEPGSSLGVSNQVIGSTLDVAVRTGVLTVLFPNAPAPASSHLTDVGGAL